MFRTITRSTRQFLTAILLLMVAVVVAEFVLQYKSSPSRHTTVSSRVNPEMQVLLVPSPTTHHEMLRLSAHRVSDDVSFVTNSFGLRGEEEPVVPKPASLLRIVFLGDDTILGPRLSPESTVGERLQEFLSAAAGVDVEVINAGVPGYCPLLSWLQYRHQLQQLDPDVVILHFDMTDVADDAVYRRSLKDNQGQQICVNHRLSPESRQGSSLANALSHSALFRLLQKETGLLPPRAISQSGEALQEQFRWTTASRVDLRLQIQHSLQPIEQFAEFASQSGFQLLLSSSPTPWQVSSDDEFPRLSRQMKTNSNWPVEEDFPFQILAAICERSSLPFCNSTAAFRAFSQPAKLFQEESISLSRYGAALYAREIASMLLSNERYAGFFLRQSNVSSRPKPLN